MTMLNLTILRHLKVCLILFLYQLINSCLIFYLINLGELLEIEGTISTRNAYIHQVNERRKWNIDNICKVTEEKTVLNKTLSNSLKAADFKPTGQTESLSANHSSPEEVILPPQPPVTTTATPTTTKAATSIPTAPTSKKVENKKETVTKPQNSVGPIRSDSPSRERLTVISYNDFVLSNEVVLENYSEIKDLESTKEFLFKNCDILMHEHSQSYLLLSCLEDEMNGKRERMKLVCRQSQILSHIQELGVSLKRDPRDVILPFFKRIEEAEYLKNFILAVNEFMEKIIKRAIVKRQEMDNEENEKYLGPGGLDPMEVLETLPETLRIAFESQNVAELRKVIDEMDPEEARFHMKRCVDSGLWVQKEDE